LDELEDAVFRAMVADITHLRELIYSAFDSQGNFIGVSRETKEEFARVVKYIEDKNLNKEEE
jgi:low affinity Fe/Cu permease